MRAAVDHHRCEGHGRCFAVAGELFDVDDDGYSVVDDMLIPAEQEAVARDAAAACPSQAIRLSD
jgi:ferredoxin